MDASHTFPMEHVGARERRSRSAQLVLLFTVCNNVDEVFVIQVARHVRREGCEHLLNLSGRRQVGKVAQKGFVAGGLLGWREGAPTSSWENLSPCVISISLMLQSREYGEHQGGLREGTRPPLGQPLHSLGRFQSFSLWIEHLECIQDRLLRVCSCR